MAGARTALVVEDDKLLADMLAAVLKGEGYNAAILHEGTGVTEWVREHHPDLILLDLMLPGRSGYDICQELKLDRETNLIPILICTARSQHEDLIHGLSVGGDFYLTKPFTIDQLHDAIRHVLAWRSEVEQSGTAGEIRFQLKSDTQYLGELNRLLASLFHHTGLDEDQVFQLTTAVREMGCNAIEWGNKKCIDQPVSVTYRIDPEKVVILIRDQGPGFDRSNLSHAACHEDPAAHMDVRKEKGLRLGGFGILLSRGMVDDLQYNDAGNEVRLVKRLGKAPATSGS